MEALRRVRPELTSKMPLDLPVAEATWNGVGKGTGKRAERNCAEAKGARGDPAAKEFNL